MKKSKILIVIGLVLALLVGCSGGSQTDTTTTDTTAGGSKKAVIQTDVDLSTMNHMIATDGTSFIAIMLTMDGLVELDANGVPYPDIAKSWDISEDGLVYTFHLDENAKWNDASAVTANDFVFGWQTLANPETASEYNYLVQTLNIVNADAVVNGEKPVEELGVKAVDDVTFEVTLTTPSSFLVSLMAFPNFFPLKQEFYEAQGDAYSTDPTKLLANGPYVLDSWTSGNNFTFQKNVNYWKENDSNVDTIEFKFIQDTQSAMLEYQAGNIDVVKLSGEMVEAYKGEPGYTERLQGYLWYLDINRLQERLTNENLLNAISFAIDRKTIAENVLKDGSIEANGFIPVGLASSPDGKDFRDVAEDLTSYDPAKAAEFYELAKAELGGDVSLDLLFEDSEASKAVAEYIQSNLETNLPGITITLNSKPKKTRLELRRNNEFDLVLHRWGPDYQDPQTYLDLYSAGVSDRYVNQKYEDLILSATKGELSTDPQGRWDAMLELERILVTETIGAIPIYQNGGGMMINPKLTGIMFQVGGVDNYRHMVIAE